MSSISTNQTEGSETLEAFVAETAVFVQQRGWTNLACLLLEAGTPLAFLGGQLIWLSQPVLSPLLSTAKIEQIAHLLEDPAALNALYEQLQHNTAS